MDTYKKPNKTLPILIIFAVVVGLIVAISFIFKDTRTPNPNEQTTPPPIPQVAVPPSGIDYPEEWVEATEIAVSEKESGVTSVATRDKPEARVFVREVDGKREPDFDINKLPDEVVSALSSEVESFTLVEKRTLKLGDNDAVKIEYTQLESGDQQIYNFVMFIIPTATKAYYVTYSTPESVTDINSDITTINQALADYMKNNP